MQLFLVFFSLFFPFFSSESIEIPCNIPLQTQSNSSQNCLVYQQLDLPPHALRVLSLSKKPHLFYLKSGNLLIVFSDCEKNRLRDCKIEISVSRLINGSRFEGLNHLNHSHYSDADRDNGVYSQISSDFENGFFKIIPNVDGRVEIYRFQAIFMKETTDFLDFKWENLENKAKKSLLNPRFREESSIIPIRINAKDYILMTGGVNDIEFFNDVWLFSLEERAWREVKGTFPKLKGHTVTLLAPSERFRNRLVVFGGNSLGKPCNTLYIAELFEQSNDFTISLKEIPSQNNTGTPLPREGHIAIAKQDKLIVFGGCDYGLSHCFSDVFTLDASEDSNFLFQWTKMSDTNSSKPPAPRENPGILFLQTSNTLFLLGGTDYRGFQFKDLYLAKLYRKCLDDCPDNSGFIRGRCHCFPGFFGPNCNLTIPPCPFNCHDRGECLPNGTCSCEDGFFGNHCQHEYCLDSCSNRGFCNRETMICNCERGVFGPNCKGDCVRDCSGNGVCRGGRCDCFPGYTGERCGKRLGFEGCWEFNRFDEEGGVNKFCLVKGENGMEGYYQRMDRSFLFRQNGVRTKDSPLALIEEKDVGIGDYGEVMLEGKMYGEREDFGGFLLEKVVLIGVSAGNRVMSMQVQDLKNGYSEVLKGVYQKGCEGKRDCFGRGYCDSEGKCKCRGGTTGIYCQFHEEEKVFESRCKDNCNFHGKCDENTGKCICFLGFKEPDCLEVVCPNNCSGRGVCDYAKGSCQCALGFHGKACERKLQCDGNCSEAGVCMVSDQNKGVCKCYRGYFGERCQKSCHLNCSNRGECDNSTGKCLCQRKFKGDYCQDYRDCRANCSERGKCFEGDCICEKGFEGIACEFEVVCPEKCQGRGVCIWGKCVCEEGFEGRACEISYGKRNRGINNDNDDILNKNIVGNIQQQQNITNKIYANVSSNYSKRNDSLGSINYSGNASNNGSNLVNGSAGKIITNGFKEKNEYSFRDVGGERREEIDFFNEKQRIKEEEKKPQDNFEILCVVGILGIAILFILNNLKRPL